LTLSTGAWSGQKRGWILPFPAIAGLLLVAVVAMRLATALPKAPGGGWSRRLWRIPLPNHPWRTLAAYLVRGLVLALGIAAASMAGLVELPAFAAGASWSEVGNQLFNSEFGARAAQSGALAGALLDKLAATYLILFLVLVDLSVMQTPMFHASPARFAELLPGYGPTRVMLEGSYSHAFNAGFELGLAFAWAVALVTAVYFVLRRALGTEAPDGEPSLATAYPTGVSSQESAR
jgi:hypothetical protein